MGDDADPASGEGQLGSVLFHNLLYRARVVLCAVLAVFSLAACSSSNISDPTPELSYVSSFAADKTPAYQLRPADQLKLVVFGQEAVSGDYTIDDKGSIALRDLGSIKAAGLTVDQLEQQIATLLNAKGVTEPQVSLILDVDRPIYVTGAVVSPGQFPFRSGLDSQTAVALAGGYSFQADTRTMYITHAGATTETRYGIADRPVINPGDVIRIPGRS
jgi:polysaccharide export outer membrane protein